MKFGKLSNLEEVDFCVPELKILQTSNQNTELPHIYIGTTGWSNKEWSGSFYPQNAKPNEYLQHYGSLFNTIELNTTHYHIPDFAKVKDWCSKVDEDFRFCPKVPQDISHRSNIASETSQSHSFYKAIASMGQNLGPCFMQLPEYFDPSQAEKLLRFLNRKPKEIPIAIELRHPKWFENDNAHLQALAKQLNEFNTGLIITDVAGRRDVAHGILSTPILMLRLVGNDLDSSDFDRIDSWIDCIQAAGNQLNEVYLFFHQPSIQNVPEMVNYFIERSIKAGLSHHFEHLEAKYIPNTQLRLF
jgi:uncharacterized protein YecE (DUF72 family)